VCRGVAETGALPGMSPVASLQERIYLFTKAYLPYDMLFIGVDQRRNRTDSNAFEYEAILTQK